ncbi:phosphopantetheine-binding protein [Streptomyces sp. 11x1]|uniref:phosphopantetheine-binding protein n=1 Tax=unclassified Streptomyces TaxID=2593676 RepID=UPI002931199D|nr:phosphopantetheine-binding protein [Streptomyces sp. 11x1]WNZ06249.1 phosphopantetheine-binding protein [Streptomyces sp. 11x1]
MTVSAEEQSPATSTPPAVSERVHAAIARRLGDEQLTPDTELTALGIDSLLLLRILGDLAVDPSQEIDPYALADVVTVADLVAFVAAWN